MEEIVLVVGYDAMEEIYQAKPVTVIRSRIGGGSSDRTDRSRAGHGGDGGSQDHCCLAMVTSFNHIPLSTSCTTAKPYLLGPSDGCGRLQSIK